MKKLFASSETLISPEDQNADFVELFFDLVFVFAITKVTHFVAHQLDVTHILQSILIFWLVWWGWTQFTWSLNAAHTKHPEIRLGTLVATGIAFVMAASTDQAFSDGVLWFAIPYIAVRMLGLGVYFRVTPVEGGYRSAVFGFAGISLLGLAAVLGGALVNPTYRIWWWFAAIALDMVAGFAGGDKEGWKIRAKHFSERHSLIVIIALGESLIVAASAVSSSERTATVVLSGGLAVLVTCLLWWSYFAWIREYLENALNKESGSSQAKLGRDAFSLIHFPLVCGIIGIAVGFEKILPHPEIPLTMPISVCLGGGVILFVGSTAASVWRSSRMLLGPRLLIIGTIAGITYLSIGQRPEFILGLIGTNLLVLLIIEWNLCRRQFKSLHVL
jgi:low temperature requirement protein LtrA